MATGLKVLHWFNPILWFAFHRMAADRELACDELVLSHAGQEQNRLYGGTIIKLLEAACGPEPFSGAVGILEGKAAMARRLSLIVHYTARPHRSVPAVLLLLGLGFIGLTDAQSRSGSGATPASTAPATPSPVIARRAADAPAATRLTFPYQGKSAEQWLSQMATSPSLEDKEYVEGRDAFLTVGKNAVAFLRRKLAMPKTLAESKRTGWERREAAWVLKELGPVAAPAVPELTAALRDENDAVASYAAMALGEIGPQARGAVPALLEALRFGCGQAAVALAKIDPGNPALVPTLIDVLEHPSVDPHGAAGLSWQPVINSATALGMLGPKAVSCAPQVKQAAQDTDPAVQAAAREALAAMEPEASNQP